MKKLFLSLAVAGMFAFFACGPSAAEIAEQARIDSLRTDSIQKDSIQKAEAEAARVADSIAKAAVADSIAKAEAAKPVKGGKKGK
jgi:hypothetical protein